MISTAADLARCLARDAEAVCRHYLPKGRRSGRYWIIGDVRNTPGRSLYVRLSGPDYGPGAAGHWTDSATGEYGDLLDLIALSRDLPQLGDAMDEARLFLAQPLPAISRPIRPARAQARAGSHEAARRLFRSGHPVPGTPAEAYLRARGISAALDWPALRFHPSVYYRADEESALEQWPALLAAVTASDGTITGVQRTWLDRIRAAKAPLADPRRALGHLLGNAVRFGTASDLLAAGEGIETMLALKSVLPDLPMAAGFVRQPPRRVRPAPANCCASISPATTIRPVLKRSNGCANAIPTSMSANSCRCTPISTTISAPSALTSCGHGWPISSSHRPRAVSRAARSRCTFAPTEFGCSAGRKKGGVCGGAVPWPERCRAGGLPSGDRPEAPGGGSFLIQEPPP